MTWARALATGGPVGNDWGLGPVSPKYRARLRPIAHMVLQRKFARSYLKFFEEKGLQAHAFVADSPTIRASLAHERWHGCSSSLTSCIKKNRPEYIGNHDAEVRAHQRTSTTLAMRATFLRSFERCWQLQPVNTLRTKMLFAAAEFSTEVLGLAERKAVLSAVFED